MEKKPQDEKPRLPYCRGTYKAWPSEQGSYDGGQVSLFITFTHSTDPYVLLDRKVVANDWNSSVSGSLLTGINIHEYGEPVDFPESFDGVWSATLPDGTLAPDDAAEMLNRCHE